MMSEHTNSGDGPANHDLGGPFRVSLDSRVVLVFLLFAGAVLMYIYHMVWAGGDFSKLIHGDERVYYYPGGLAIIEQGLTWFLEPRSLWTGPVNPIWVALFGAHIALIKFANIGLFVGSGILVWDLGRRLSGNMAALLSVAMFATFIPFYQFFPTLLTEPVFVFLLIAGVWLIAISDTASIWAPIGSGAILGLATLTRPILQLFPLFLIAVWLVLGGVSTLARAERTKSQRLQRWFGWIDRKVEWIRSVRLQQLLLLAVGFAIIVVPYFAKNVVAVDHAALANGSGAVLYIGNDLRKGGDEPAYSDMTFDTGEITAPFKHLDTEGDMRLTIAAIDRIKRDPLDVVLLQPKKAVRLVLGSKDHYFWPQDNIVSFMNQTTWFKQFRIWDMLLTVSIAVFGLVGIVFLRVKPMARLLFGSIIVYFVGIHTILFPIPRLVLPMFPFLMILAGGVLVARRRVVRLAAVAITTAILLYISFAGAFASPGVSAHYTTYFDPVVEVDLTERIVRTNDVIPVGGGWYETTGDDPYVVIETPPFTGALNQVIFVTMSTVSAPDDDTSAVGRLFWVENGGVFSEDNSVPFYIESDGVERVYRISPSFAKREQWVGATIVGLRVDPPGSQQGLQFRIAEIEVKK